MARTFNHMLSVYLLNAQPSQSFVTIGLFYNSTASKWLWDDGSEASYTNWYTESPLFSETYGCAFMKLQAPYIGEWFNSGCETDSYAVLCERESFEF